jgi:hypothetical protein
MSSGCTRNGRGTRSALISTPLGPLHYPGSILDTLLLCAVLATNAVLWRRAANWQHAALICALSLVAYGIIGNLAIPIAGAIVAAALIATHRPGDDASPAPLLRQLAVVLGALAAYTAIRSVIESDPGPAMSNARDILAFEKAFGSYVEPDIQSFVMRSEIITRAFNTYYSFGFLAFVGSTLLWLWFRDRPNYLLMRNALGISVVLAVITISLYPVAPPRLLPESNMIDTIAYYGREHAFANEFAAVPSLHVGWMALSGYVLARSIGGWRGAIVGSLIGLSMALTVIITGNHYWIDGVIGSAYTLIPAMILAQSATYRAMLGTARRFSARVIVPTLQTLSDEWRARLSMIGLGVLLTYLLANQVVDPGFTDYWGYLVFQVAIIMLALLAGEVYFAEQGGLSWITHAIAVACCWADVLGTAGHLYARIDEYDKLTHFAGVGAVTAFAYDGLRGLGLKGKIDWTPNERMAAAIIIGIAVGVAWEVYEYLGDKVFNTARVNSSWDTINDLISDTLGAVVIAVSMWYVEITRQREPTRARSDVD